MTTEVVKNPTPLWAAKHRTVKYIAEQWDMSVDLVRELFANEPDVMALSRPETRNKRGYTTLFIPESVISRVHARLVIKAKPRPNAPRS